MKALNAKTVYFRSYSAKDKIDEVQKIGRRLFRTEDGAIFLSVLLDDLFYTRPAKDEKEMALKNFGTFLLKERLGLTHDSLAVTAAILNLTEETSNADIQE